MVVPVNPNRKTVLGIKAYSDISDLSGEIDLAIIATPAPTVPELVARCAKSGVRTTLIISAGFAETGPAGVELERQIKTAFDPSQMRILGPNCLGLMNPVIGLNATFAAGTVRPGNVAFISQSGAS